MKKEYIRPRILGTRFIAHHPILQSSVVLNNQETLTSSSQFEAKRGNFDDSYEDDYPGNSPHNIDLWADEVEREMAYGH